MLAADPRWPIWIRRALAATVAAVAVSIWLDWRLGLTAAALVAITDTVYRARTTAAVPAEARLTSAQRKTRRQLAWFNRAGYVALNARAIRGSDAIIDHFVIGPSGIYAVDSERWDRRLPVRTTVGGELFHGPFNQRDRLRHARWEAEQAGRLVGAVLGIGLRVQPAMAIYGPTIPWVMISIGGVDVFSGRRLRSYLRRQARERRPQLLTAGQIERIRVAAERALPPSS